MSGNNGSEFGDEQPEMPYGRRMGAALEEQVQPTTQATEVPVEEVDLGEFSTEEVDKASTEARQEAERQDKNIAERHKQLKAEKDKLDNEGQAPTTIEDQIEQEFQSAERTIRTILAEEIRKEEARQLSLIQNKQAALNSRKGMRKLWKYVVEFFGYSTEIVLPKTVNPSEVLDTVIQNYLVRSKAEIHEQEGQLEVTRKRKGGAEEKVDNYTKIQFENLDLYDEADARVTYLNQELAKLKSDKNNLLQKRAAPGYKGEAENLWRINVANIETNENEKKKLQKVKKSIKRDMKDIHLKLVSHKKKLKLHERTDELLEDSINKLRTVYGMLRDYKDQETERASIVEIYKGLSGSGKLTKTMGDVNAQYDLALARMIGAIDKASKEDFPTMRPELEDAIEDNEETENEQGNDIVEIYRTLRDR